MDMSLQLRNTFESQGFDINALMVDDVKRDYKKALQELFQGYEPHSKQALFHELGKSARQRLFLGGNRTGKTLCACVEVAFHLTGLYPKWWKGRRYDHPVDVWVAGVSKTSTKTVLQDQYYLGNHKHLGYIPEHLITKQIKSHHIPEGIERVRVRHVSGGESSLEFMSYDQGREKFQGTKRDIIHFDEEPPLPVYQESLMRMLGTGDHEEGMIILTMTPLKGMTELLSSFMEIPEGHVIDTRAMVQASWEDNPHLTDEQREVIIEHMSPSEQKARQYGIPSLGSGMVYGLPLSEIVVPNIPIPAHWPRCYGMDFGWSNETAVIFLAKDRENDTTYVYAEYKQNETTPQQHVRNLRPYNIEDMHGAYDPAGDSRSQNDGEKTAVLYKEEGLSMRAGEKAKEKGTMQILQMFQNGQLKLFDTVKETIKELQGYARDEKGTIIKRNDHLMDALRYAVVTALPGAQPFPQAQRRYVHHAHPQSWMGN